MKTRNLNLVILMSLFLFQSCKFENGFFEIEVDEQPEITEPAAPTPTPADALTVFTNTIYNPLLRNTGTARCLNCHRAGGSPQIAPFFASDNVQDAYNTAISLGFFNLTNPAASRYVTKVGEGHYTWTGSAANDSNTFLVAVQSMAAQLTPAPIPTPTPISTPVVPESGQRIPFVFKVKVTEFNEAISLPINFQYDFDFTVNWGDGSAIETLKYEHVEGALSIDFFNEFWGENYGQNKDGKMYHTYTDPGEYTVVLSGYMEAMSQDYFEKTYGIVPSCKISEVIDLGDMGWTSLKKAFWGCEHLTKFNGGIGPKSITSLNSLFGYSINLVEINLTNFNTENITDMGGMFRELSQIESLDLSNFDTSNVTAMWGMFNGATSLKDLDISSFDTSKVRSMNTMFEGTESLNDLDLSHFNTANVISMYGMFEDHGGASLDLSNFNTSNVSSMSSMFRGAKNLTSLNISSFNTFRVTGFRSMFQGVEKLEELDLSHFSVDNLKTGVTTHALQRTFQGMFALKRLNVTGWFFSTLPGSYLIFGEVNSELEVTCNLGGAPGTGSFYGYDCQ
jgi:surface protein